MSAKTGKRNAFLSCKREFLAHFYFMRLPLTALELECLRQLYADMHVHPERVKLAIVWRRKQKAAAANAGE